MMAVLADDVTGIMQMMLIQQYREKATIKSGMLVAIGIDIFVDGISPGISPATGAKTGIMLHLALIQEILFPGLSVVGNLKTMMGSTEKCCSCQWKLFMTAHHLCHCASLEQSMNGLIIQGTDN